MTTKITEEKRIRDLGGATDEVDFGYAGQDFKVPAYPGTVGLYIDSEIREGYIIQEVPGGYRYISIDHPDFEMEEDGIERRLPVADEYGSVVESIRAAVQSARDHLHGLMGERADGYREWSKRLAEDAAKLPLENIVESYTDARGTGYLIQQTEEGLFRWIYVEPLMGDEVCDVLYYTPLGAAHSAYGDWLSSGGHQSDNEWSFRLCADAYREDSSGKDAVAEYLAAELPELTPERIEELSRHIRSLSSK